MSEADTYTTVVDPFIKEVIKRLRERNLTPNEPGHRNAFITFPPIDVLVAHQFVENLLFSSLRTAIDMGQEFVISTKTRWTGKNYMTDVVITYPNIAKGQTP